MHLIIIWKRFPWPCTARLVEGNTNATKTGSWKAPSALWKTRRLPIKEGNGLCPREDTIGLGRFIVTWESSGGRPSSLLTRSASVRPGPPAPGAGWTVGKRSHPASETTQKDTGKQTRASGWSLTDSWTANWLLLLITINGIWILDRTPWFDWQCPEFPRLWRFPLHCLERGFFSGWEDKKKKEHNHK